MADRSVERKGTRTVARRGYWWAVQSETRKAAMRVAPSVVMTAGWKVEQWVALSAVRSVVWSGPRPVAAKAGP